MAKPLSGMRIVVCGKGGSGKSTLVALMARVLTDRGYEVHVLDGDASNPGLYRMLGFEEAPEPLIEFYGGKTFTDEPGKVTCPVDDPTPLPRGKIRLDEIPSKYFVEKDGITLFTSGKIERAYEGCHGPESKVTRDFRIPGDQVTLIDIEGGVEHLARGIEVNTDGVIAVVDPNSTSFLIAERVKKMVEEMKGDVENARERTTDELRMRYAWAILNKVNSEELGSIMTRELRRRGIEPIGSVRYDPEVFGSCLEGVSLSGPRAKENVEEIVDRLEELVVRYQVPSKLHV